MKKSFLLIFLLSFPSVYGVEEGSGVTPFNATLLPPILSAEILNFTIPNPNVPQGQSVEFDVEVKNTGTIDINVTSEIQIFRNDTGEYVDTVLRNYGSISPDAIVTIISYWSTNTYALGTYRAVAKVMYDGQNTTNVTEYFNIVSPPLPAIAPPAVTPVIPVIPPPELIIEFVRWTVLREVVPGQTIVLGILVQNIGNSTLSDLKIKVDGVPKEWVTISPETMTLMPHEKKGFNIGVSVSPDAPAGDYKVVISIVNGAIHTENFFILRVKAYVPGYDKPKIVRVVEVDRSTGTTKVEIIVSNPIKNFPLVQVVEEIPKELANSTDIIDFDPPPTKILRKDPRVQWDLINLTAGEIRKIFYSVPKILEEFTGYVYWPLEQVNILVVKGLPVGFKIIDLRIPTLYPGLTSKIVFKIKNTEAIRHVLKTTIEAPPEWRLEPEEVKDELRGGEIKEFSFSITSPLWTTPGTYILRFIFDWDGQVVVKEYVVQVQSYLPIITLVLCIIIILLSYLLLRRSRRRRPFVAKRRKKS
jgi:hypothetical protein